MDRYQVVIVGAGPAGLTAATYLGRFRRKVLVLDGGRSRADWIPESHNTPGFPRGIGGPALLAQMSEQASLYGAERRRAKAISMTRQAAGFAILTDQGQEPGRTAYAPFVLLATGVLDRLPAVEGLEASIRSGCVRICPICDAYEAIDQRIAVLGDGDQGAREALFLTTYSRDVTLLHLGALETLTDLAGLAARGVAVRRISIEALSLNTTTVRVRAEGRDEIFDCLYLALGCEMQSRLAARWGAAHDEVGNLLVSPHQETSIDGLYAAGDVVRGLNQIAVAAAEAAIAATDIHRRLRMTDAAEIMPVSAQTSS